MSECKHETIGFWYDDDGRSTPYCTNPKCGASGEQLVSELQQMIAERDTTIKKQARALEDVHDLVRFLESGNDRIMMQAELKSYERQLEAAANDSIKFIRCFNCPMERVNGLKCVSLDCKALWRKRWEEASK